MAEHTDSASFYAEKPTFKGLINQRTNVAFGCTLLKYKILETVKRFILLKIILLTPNHIQRC